MRWYVLALCSLLCCWPAAAQKARIAMSSSASRVQVGEPFAIEIRADLSGEEPDDIAVPDFGTLEVLAQRISRPMSFSFGFGSGGQHARVESHIIQNYTVRATQPGKVVIQPAILTVKGRKLATQPLTIEAFGSALGPSANGAPAGPPDEPDDAQPSAPPVGGLTGARYDNDVFLRTVADKERAYLGEQVTVTVYLYVRGALAQNPNITREPTTEGFWIQDLLPIQRTQAPVRQEVNGRMFQVYVLRRFAAFPLRAGKLEIGAPAIEISAGPSVFDLLTGPSEPLRRRGVSAPVEAMALPKAPGSSPIHVGELTLDATLEPNAAKVGDALTLRVTAKGTGNLKALKLIDPVIANADVLSPEIDDRMTNDLDRIGGERTFRWLVLPRTPGTLKIAPFEVQVFDPSSQSYRQVRTGPLSATITGQAQPAPLAPPTASAPEETPAGLELGPPKLRSELRRRAAPLTDARWYWGCLAAGPMLVLGFVATRFVHRKVQARRARGTSDSKLRFAVQKLNEARDASRKSDPTAVYGLLITALRGALQERLGEPVGGLTRPALRDLSIRKGLPERLAERLGSALDAFENARFNPTGQNAGELEAHLREATTLVDELARSRSKEAA